MNLGCLIMIGGGVVLLLTVMVIFLESAYDDGFEDGFEQGKEAGMKSHPSSPIPQPSHTKEVR